MEKIFKVLQSDKSLHLLVGFFICVILQYPIQYEGFAISVLLGICKEMYDKNHSNIHTEDIWDAIATTIGALIGLITIFLY